MRSKAVFIILLSMFVALVGVTLFRPRPLRPVEVAGATSSSNVTVPALPEAPVPSASGSALPHQAASAASAAPSPADGGALPAKMNRPVRVIGLGWDVLAPGLIANQGREPGKAGEFKAVGLDVALTPTDAMTAVESALARGGADPLGADIAIAPLPSLVASYERLRALDPRVFYVVGWSRGREALVAGKGSIASIPASGKVTVAGAPGTTATYLALFTLDLVGVPGARIELLPEDKAGEALFLATDRGGLTGDKPARGAVVVTTADATRLIPIVAIAQAGLTTDKQEALRAWVRGWMAGQQKVRGDTAGSAREIGAMPGAPDPLVLVQSLGSLSWASLEDNARMAGLSGRGAVTTEALFQNAWRIWRDARVLTTPPPESATTEPAIVSSIIRASGASEAPTGKGGNKPAAPGDGPTLLSIPGPAGKVDEAAVVTSIGWVAGLFDRSTIRIAIRGPRGVDPVKTKGVIASAADRFDLPISRLVEGKKVVGTGAASIEVQGIR